MTAPATSSIDALVAGRDLLTLAARLLSVEIDARLYGALRSADGAVPPDPADPPDAGGPPGPAALPMVSEELGLLPEEHALEELAAEFCRLFIGPRPVCSPYESVFRGEALLGGRAERRVRDFLARRALRVALPPGVPVLSYDHVAVELTVLSRLCSAGPEGPEDPEGREAIGEFLDHLRPWITDYLYELHDVSRLAPYSTVAVLTARLLGDA